MSALLRSDTQSFVLPTALVAEVAALREWLAVAEPGEKVIYCQGLDLAREAPGVVLVAEWQAEGRVHLAQRRDPGNPHRWQWLAEKRAVGSRALQMRVRKGCDRATLAEKGELLRHLRELAKRKAACPSNNELSRKLGFGLGERGRQRARYLLGLLEAEGAITLVSAGRNAPRALTVHKKGNG